MDQDGCPAARERSLWPIAAFDWLWRSNQVCLCWIQQLPQPLIGQNYGLWTTWTTGILHNATPMKAPLLSIQQSRPSVFRATICYPSRWVRCAGQTDHSLSQVAQQRTRLTPPAAIPIDGANASWDYRAGIDMPKAAGSRARRSSSVSCRRRPAGCGSCLSAKEELRAEHDGARLSMGIPALPY